ncbi:MAG: cysteine hydrolase [Polyangiaceae bacterium]|nr:cysteine hydrolase [Myxococcales bacterium]MCB9588299.1 cysteine hydrolase [Polyangiaceae bacterium]
MDIEVSLSGASNLDPLKDVYREAVSEAPEAQEAIAHRNVALLVIDVQYLDAARGHGVFADAEKSGVPADAQEYYFNRLENLALPNIRRLQDAFRGHRLEVIHTRIMSLTQNGRDRSPGHKRLGLHAAPGSKDAEFIEQVAPQGDEIVFSKTASGVFVSTNLEFVLRNMDIHALFMCGVYTNECVETTARDASDLGFFTSVIEDACATVTPELHNSSLNTLRDRYAKILTTEEAIAELEANAKLQASAKLRPR